jgi:PAS domain S-box-containing protein
MTSESPDLIADGSARLSAEAAEISALRQEQPMMWLWSHRPRFIHLGAFFAAYFVGCAFAEVLGIVPGTDIAIWPPGGVFMATLIVTPQRTWPWWVLAGCLAEMLGQLVWFHSPLPAGLIMYLGNALAATAGAYLVNRVSGRSVRLNTLREVLAFVVLGAIVAPALSATVGAAAIDWFDVRSQTFIEAWPLWWIGDATGILIVGPFSLAVIQNWRGAAPLSAARWIEASALGLVLLGVAAFSLSGPLPFAYLIMPPLLWAAVRFEFRGAVVALTILALITIAFTISGAGQFAGDTQSQREKLIMLQLFLAISALSALIVAAISRQHQLAMQTLQQSMETLRERERELSLLVDMVPSHVWRLTPDGEPTFFNKRMVDFLGLDVPDTQRPGVSRLDAMIGAAVYPDDAAAFGDGLRHCLATGEAFAARYRLRRGDGAYHWMSSRAEPLRDQAGRIVQWYGLCHDIDDQVKAEEALRQSERQLQEMIDAVPVRIWSSAPNGGPVYFNKRYQDHFRSVIANFEDIREPRIEPLLQELVHPDETPSVERTLGRCFESGQGAVMRFRWREKDGIYRWAECRVEPRRDEKGAIVQWYGASIDIDDEVRAQSELRRMQERLAQASQAASLAELSASIAHEVNQPLAAVVANSHACQRWLTADPPNLERAQTTIERIIRDANGAADVVSRIRALFKQDVEVRNGSSLAAIVSEAARSLSDLATRHRAIVETRLDPSLPLLAIDQVQMQQVLINLMRNAVEAMAASPGTRTLSVSARADGDVVQVEVSDTGPGIGNPEQMFDAFFTTKQSGMGMGLAVSRSIVESHGGRLWAEQNKGGGARFIFTLPTETPAPP